MVQPGLPLTGSSADSAMFPYYFIETVKSHMVVLTAQQPLYLPNTGFFRRMAQADRFVFADTVQFTSHDLINRSRIKTPGGARWLTVPILSKGKGKQRICDVRIEPTSNWRRKHWKLLQVNYRYAPYFEFYADFFDDLYRKEWKFLMELNLRIIEFLKTVLGISTPAEIGSQYNLQWGDSEKIIGILNALNCDAYLAREEDRHFLDSKQFGKAGKQLRIDSFSPPVYRQQFAEFIPGLSVVDLLFNEGPASKNILGVGSATQQ